MFELVGLKSNSQVVDTHRPFTRQERSSFLAGLMCPGNHAGLFGEGARECLAEHFFSC